MMVRARWQLTISFTDSFPPNSPSMVQGMGFSQVKVRKKYDYEKF